MQINEGGKKDSSKRRHELLVDSGLAEVAMGCADGILHPTLNEKLSELYEAITSLAAQRKTDEPDVEHILEHFHSNALPFEQGNQKTGSRLPYFASTLREKALKGKCAIWAKGHSSKVINAFMKTSNTEIKEMAKEELQPLIENGDLSPPPNESAKNE